MYLLPLTYKNTPYEVLRTNYFEFTATIYSYLSTSVYHIHTAVLSGLQSHQHVCLPHPSLVHILQPLAPGTALINTSMAATAQAPAAPNLVAPSERTTSRTSGICCIFAIPAV